MNIIIRDGAIERVERSHADVREEIRLMAEATREHDAPPREAPSRSLFARLFSRPSRLAA